MARKPPSRDVSPAISHSEAWALSPSPWQLWFHGSHWDMLVSYGSQESWHNLLAVPFLRKGTRFGVDAWSRRQVQRVQMMVFIGRLLS